MAQMILEEQVTQISSAQSPICVEWIWGPSKTVANCPPKNPLQHVYMYHHIHVYLSIAVLYTYTSIPLGTCQPKALPLQLPGLCQTEVLLPSPQLEIYWSPSHPPFQGSTTEGQPPHCSESWCPQPSHHLAAQHLLRQHWVRALFCSIQFFLLGCTQAPISYCALFLYFKTSSEVKYFFIYLFAIFMFLLQTECVAHFSVCLLLCAPQLQANPFLKYWEIISLEVHCPEVTEESY